MDVPGLLEEKRVGPEKLAMRSFVPRPVMEGAARGASPDVSLASGSTDVAEFATFVSAPGTEDSRSPGGSSSSRN